MRLVMLPHATGHGILAALRKDEDWKSAPVVMLTAKSQEGDIVRAVDAGPFQPAELPQSPHSPARARQERVMRARTPGARMAADGWWRVRIVIQRSREMLAIQLRSSAR